MSLFQTLVLLMFNEGDGFSFEEIKMATGIGRKTRWDVLKRVFTLGAGGGRSPPRRRGSV